MKTLDETLAEIEKKECGYPYEAMVYARDVEEILEANWPKVSDEPIAGIEARIHEYLCDCENDNVKPYAHILMRIINHRLARRSEDKTKTLEEIVAEIEAYDPVESDIYNEQLRCIEIIRANWPNQERQ